MTKILSIQSRPHWLPQGATLTLVQDKTIPPSELSTSVHALCFQEQNLLMIHHEKRGWDIPGGHKEPGESIEEALIREVLEEGAALIQDIQPIAYFKISLSGLQPIDYRYPYPESYLPFFSARIKELLPFKGEFESTDRRLVSPNEALSVERIRAHQDLYMIGLQEVSSFEEPSKLEGE